MKTKRELGLFHALIMGLSGAIGFEIFALLDYAYWLSGTSVLFALLLAGLMNLLIMLNYCELSTAIPEIGGAYTYIKKAYGGIVSFILGCFRWLASVFGAALAAVVFTDQLLYLLKVDSTLQSLVSNQTPLIAVIVVISLAALNVKGMKKVGAAIVFAFIAIFAIFVGSGLLGELAPAEVFPKNLSNVSEIFAATVYVFPMFFGVRSLIAGAAQIKHPGKNLPRAILLSALLIIPLYLCVTYVAVGIVPLEEWRSLKVNGSQVPLLNFAAERIFGVAGAVLLGIAGMVASLSALSTSLMVQSSILCGMSRDAYLPKFLLSVHQRFRTLYVAIITGSLFIMFLSVIGALEFLGYAASFASLLVFALVNLSLLKLRKEKPHMVRPFKTPLYPFTPVAGFIMSFALLVFPMLLRDVNATNALISGIGLTVLVLMTYYFRMMGRNRLQIAIGGVGLGIGVSLLFLTYLAQAGFVSPIFPNISSHIMFCISAIFIMAGILNVTAHS